MVLTKGLYTVIKNEENSFTIRLSNETHPVFKAHFPDKAILPGFLQIDIASEVLNHPFTSLKKIKFIKPVFPNSLLKYEYTPKKITITSLDEKISEFLYE